MRLIRLLILVCLAAALFTWLQSRQDQTLALHSISLSPAAALQSADANLPVTIGGAHQRALRIGYNMPGEAITADLNIMASTHAFEVIAPNGTSQKPRCANDPAAPCRVRLHLGGDEQYVTLLASGPVTITAVSTDLFAVKRIAHIGGLSVIAVLLLLLLFGPIFWRLQSTAAQYLLILIGVAWLTIASWQLALAMLTLLALIFAVLQTMMRSDHKARWFAIGVGLAIGALLLVKAVLPLAADFFANPGEFFFLPLGFSYFVIRIIDLLFKIHARQIKQLSIREHFAYLLFPPTLAAGPIMTILEFRSGFGAFATLTDRTWGLLRVGSGLLKKAMADLLMLYFIAPRMDADFFGADKGDVPAVLLANVLFVFLDFSAYSDMAIGVARWWGWRVPENFDWPLLRRTMREFWRHWHMSLTQWVTRHVFMQASMEVRRAPKWAQAAIPTFTTMLVIGLWHGFLFIWVLWAVHHLAGIKLGDAVTGWAKRPGPAQVLNRVQNTIGQNGYGAALRLTGIAFVWWWVALSHAFTTTTNIGQALTNYATLLSMGLL